MTPAYQTLNTQPAPAQTPQMPLQLQALPDCGKRRFVSFLHVEDRHRRHITDEGEIGCQGNPIYSTNQRVYTGCLSLGRHTQMKANDLRARAHCGDVC